MMGISGSGKTALARQIAGESFINKYLGTCLDHYSSQVLVESKPVELNIFTMIGSDDMYNVRMFTIKECQGFVIVYSIELSDFFGYLSNYEEFRRTIFSVKDKDIKRDTVPIVLVGSKSDLEAERRVSREEGEKLAREWGCPFYEASGKTGHNVEEVFMDVVHQIHQKKSSECSLFMCHSCSLLCAKVVPLFPLHVQYQYYTLLNCM